MVTPDPDSPMRCARCDTALEFVGTKEFGAGKQGGVLGGLGELFPDRKSFDVYVCGRCGRLELFVDGIGEEHRAR